MEEDKKATFLAQELKNNSVTIAKTPMQVFFVVTFKLAAFILLFFGEKDIRSCLKMNKQNADGADCYDLVR